MSLRRMVWRVDELQQAPRCHTLSPTISYEILLAKNNESPNLVSQGSVSVGGARGDARVREKDGIIKSSA